MRSPARSLFNPRGRSEVAMLPVYCCLALIVVASTTDFGNLSQLPSHGARCRVRLVSRVFACRLSAHICHSARGGRAREPNCVAFRTRILLLATGSQPMLSDRKGCSFCGCPMLLPALQDIMLHGAVNAAVFLWRCFLFGCCHQAICNLVFQMRSHLINAQYLLDLRVAMRSE